MQKALFGATALLAAFAFLASPGCGSDDDNGGNAGRDGSAAGSDGSAAGSGGGGGTTQQRVTFEADIKPIVMAKCATGVCHSTNTLKWLEYADTQLSAYSSKCTGKKKGECMNIRVKDGSMPANKGCTGDPAMDTGNAACLTAAEHQKFDAWVIGGLIEK